MCDLIVRFAPGKEQNVGGCTTSAPAAQQACQVQQRMLRAASESEAVLVIMQWHKFGQATE
jgi:hypothetical protein